MISGDGFPPQGSLDDEISLGAYVAAALLELGQPLKVSRPLLLAVILFSPVPAPCSGEKTQNPGLLQSINRLGAAKRVPVFGEIINSF